MLQTPLGKLSLERTPTRQHFSLPSRLLVRFSRFKSCVALLLRLPGFSVSFLFLTVFRSVRGMSFAKRSLNVGVVGMGRMGVPIARNIAFKSRNAVYLQLHSRSLARAKEVGHSISFDGAQCAMRLHNQYATVTKWCDVVVAALQDVQAARRVMLDLPDALVRNARPGQIIVDHTTTDVGLARECAQVAQQRGAVYLDAPLSGNPQSALNGQLTVMVGGDESSFLKVLPLLRLYGETIDRMGDSGSGSAAKGICQMLVALHTVAAAEALTMAHQLGVEDSDKLLSVLDASWGSSTMLRRNAGTMQKLLRNPEKPPPASSATVDSLLHDVGLLYLHPEAAADGPGLGARNGPLFESPRIHDAVFPLFHRACNILARTSTAGGGDRDLAGVVHFLDTSEAVELPRTTASASSAAAAAMTTTASGAAGASVAPIVADADSATPVSTAPDSVDEDEGGPLEFY